MSKVIMQIEIDDELKKDADKLFSELGLDTNTAINIFLKKSINNQAIPFKIEKDSFYNDENINILIHRYNNLKKGECVEINY
ncbi:type II toxin-antitoxin system RelB/DinJ family antitoxin [uncultured Brachyspira sp.]|uniref:type II toxin-antitoxin system RelB/DinJ family antitoxin n=1 Tax=uncultured Brachyspira sp. TaxID=221953 RepID=UPI00260C76AB|nr:type II toxin-antitoxin system RelB/DinJ family antitoxin [uncultured Brachyspira sp.]